MHEEIVIRKKNVKGDVDLDDLVCVVTCATGSLGGDIRDAVEEVVTVRDNVVMMRVDSDSRAKMDELVEAGIWKSRSEAAAYLIREGIKARRGLFDRISEKVGEIRKAKEELRGLLGEQDAEPSGQQET